jgi:hypothetical protein
VLARARSRLRRSRLSVTLCVGVVTFSGSHVVSATLGDQSSTTQWNVPADVTAVDRRDILQLAGQLKINDPELVSTFNSGCRAVRVVSRPKVDGHRVLSHWLLIRRASGAGCEPVASGQPVKRVGNWLTGGTVAIPVERWRVRDGNWHVDVHLGAGVPYSDAEIIIRAIRRGELADQRPLGDRVRGLPSIDAGAITVIERPHQGIGTPAPHPRQYEVRTGDKGGDSFSIRIAEGRVEVHRYGQWRP